MATAQEVITLALRDLTVLGIGKDAKASEASYCLSKLNNMLSGWEIEGIDLAHATTALTDALDVPASHIRGISLNLAVELMAFGDKQGPLLMSMADAAKSAIRAYHFQIAELGGEHPLSKRPAR